MEDGRLRASDKITGPGGRGGGAGWGCGGIALFPILTRTKIENRREALATQAKLTALTETASYAGYFVANQLFFSLSGLVFKPPCKMASPSEDQQPASHASWPAHRRLLLDVHRVRDVGPEVLTHAQSLQLASRLPQPHVPDGRRARMRTKPTEQRFWRQHKLDLLPGLLVFQISPGQRLITLLSVVSILEQTAQWFGGTRTLIRRVRKSNEVKWRNSVTNYSYVELVLPVF